MTVTQTGKAIECHPTASYPGDVWYMIPREDKEKLSKMRKNSQGGHSNHSIISEITQGTQFSLPPPPPPQQGYFQQPPQQMQMQMAQVNTNPPLPPPPPPLPSDQSHQRLPQVSFMGGRNEQSSLRSRNPGNP